MTDPDHPSESAPPPPVPIVVRPKLAFWIWQRALAWREAGGLIGRSHEAVRRYCLPFNHPERSRPDDETRRRIDWITLGEVPPASFDEPTAAERPA